MTSEGTDKLSCSKIPLSLKAEREWYKDIHADVLQEMVKRVDLAFARFIKRPIRKLAARYLQGATHYIGAIAKSIKFPPTPLYIG